MAASPSSAAATSDIDQASSPVALDDKSVASRGAGSPAGSDDEDTQMADEAAEVRDKPTRGRARASMKGGEPAHQIGKIRHLKKEDGEPLWREDIQYDLLRAIFDNEQKVFTNSYDAKLGKQCFADLYIDTMSRSSKTSKVLRDKLLSDRDAAKGMAMVCLLVNVGRMNTTLNFFPEMRAQLRTYHAIPSLQAHQDAHAYKQLQDAPRLKSILKGGAEDREEPNSLEKIKRANVPRTNPVNLIFSMCHSAQKVAELHFPDGQEFHDLIMKTQFTSTSRAMAFLWLMWFYLESDFTEEGCEENPFGAGVDYGLDVANQGVPRLVEMTEDEQAKENVDSPEEIEFGREKQKTRAKILEMDQAYLNERDTKRGGKRAVDDGPAILPRIRPSKHDSDRDSTRSTPPPRGVGRGGRRGLGLKYQIFEGSSPARHGSEGVGSRKPRPPTAHQLAVERNRSERVEYILDRGLRKQHHRTRRVRRVEGAIFRAHRRLQAQEDPFEDSDAEDAVARMASSKDKAAVFREKGIGGLCLLADEPDDYGEEVSAYAAALRRSTRRLGRWAGRESELGVIAPVKKPKAKSEVKNTDGGADEGLAASPLKNGDTNGDVTMGDADIEETAMMDDEDLDDQDKTEVLVDSEGE
ncbi:uncharacterized protein UV8b_03717 [Ustilaginoidea virens]|uniref:INO80 chromatin remodeling complex Ies1 n=1 Tax=Ustilaginoidea virens TaxID=1159556 RepID=A0A1B5L708_USTVR|nr:uncharacterized protein UV8b_03717 [Ustilaginoidea virens]QUC19476.1 hypothetical protein UV8b_03717 [Ustilaginoidea virens]GAO19422.1 hypothetical protein UVI_02063190 [Ustilaginoidea virens]